MVTTKKILESIPLALRTINIPKLGKKISGKIRDSYLLGDKQNLLPNDVSKRILITTDRLSAFDRILGCFPFKGQALNQLSEFWFNNTLDIVQNHLISLPDPNVMLVKSAKVIPIEMVVRGYISGVTNTSIWGSYNSGERVIYGVKFPEGLKKNQKLPEPVITPTTKAEKGHDERLTEKEIFQRKIISLAIWKQMKKAALALFERGTKICAKAGIILVDTKYEFGILDGKLILVDEIHTPDSSRYWKKDTYHKRFSKGLEPENFDKEFLRIWYAKRGYKGDGEPPKMPEEFMAEVSKRYITIFEKITGKKFKSYSYPIEERIKENLSKISLPKRTD